MSESLVIYKKCEPTVPNHHRMGRSLHLPPLPEAYLPFSFPPSTPLFSPRFTLLPSLPPGILCF